MKVKHLFLVILWVWFVLVRTSTAQTDSCRAGFFGNNCAICENNQACIDQTGDSEATCSNDVNFKSNSQLKSYSCGLTDGLLAGLLAPGSLLVQCHTGLTGNQTLSNTADSSPPPESGGRRLLQQTQGPQGFCEISFTVADPLVGVACNATACVMGANSARAVCDTASCACEDGVCGQNALIQTLISQVQGPVVMDCQEGGACSLVLSGLPVQSIPAQCDVGECLVPLDQELGNVTNSGPSNLNTNPIFAAIPSMVLVLIITFLGSYALANRQLWSYSIGAADAEELERLAKVDTNPVPRLGSLEFKHLSLAVPMVSQKQIDSRLAALRAHALSGAANGGTSPSRKGSGKGALLQAAKHTLLGRGEDVEAHLEQSSVELNAEAKAAADFVGGLHTEGGSNHWYILKDLSFSARGGEVVGVLGPSGCGKTSLLASIAGSAGDMGGSAIKSGHVLVDGQRRRKRDVAYVPQSDVLIPSLTVEECVRYSALLRLPVDTKPLDLQVRIEKVLEELGIQHVANSQVGGSGRIRGISGGERRRVTIGMELVTDPAIIVLDEPTSGLDSFTAINLMRSLRQVAGGGRVVIASLHQPSRDMFLSLDQIVLMSHGRMLYAGRPADAHAWFARRGLPCPEGSDMAEHMLMMASSAPDVKRLLEQKPAAHPAGLDPQACAPAFSSAPTREDSVMDTLRDGKFSVELEMSASFSFQPPSPAAATQPQPEWHPPPPAAAAAAVGMGAPAPGAQHGRHRSSAHSATTSFSESELGAGEAVYAGQGEGHSRKSRKPGVSRQLAVLFWRSWVDMVRSPTLLRLHVIIALAMGIMTGFVFWNLELDNVGVQNRMGGTFFALAFFAFASLTTVDLLMNERAVAIREVRGGYYNPVLYLLSKLTLDGVLLRMIPAVLYWAPFYYMAGFRTGSAYAATYVFLLICFSGAVGALSMAVTVVADTPGQASFSMNFLLLFSLIFTGFLVNVDSIPSPLRWLHYLSVFYYAFEAMISSEISGLGVSFQAAGFGEVAGVTGDTFLRTLGFNPANTTRNIWILVGMYGAFALLAMLLFVLRLPRTSHGRRARWWAQLKQRLGLAK